MLPPLPIGADAGSHDTFVSLFPSCRLRIYLGLEIFPQIGLCSMSMKEGVFCEKSPTFVVCRLPYLPALPVLHGAARLCPNLYLARNCSRYYSSVSNVAQIEIPRRHGATGNGRDQQRKRANVYVIGAPSPRYWRAYCSRLGYTQEAGLRQGMSVFHASMRENVPFVANLGPVDRTLLRENGPVAASTVTMHYMA